MDVHLSHWEKVSWLGPADYLIIGSGIVGLSAALALKERYPLAEVKVLERALIPCGGSTKNAGFACFGSVSELWDDLQGQSMTEVMDLVEMRWRGLQRLRERIGDDVMDFEPCGGWELFGAEDEGLFGACRDLIPTLNQELEKITGLSECYSEEQGKLRDFGFAGVSHLVLNRGEGLIDTGKMMRRLLALAQSKGILVMPGVEVSHWEQMGGALRVFCKNGWSLDCGKILLTTNGFSRQFFPDLAVAPARAQVLITSEISDLPFKGGFHYDRGYYYFRHLGRRVLFGGGRNLDPDGETTTDLAVTEPIQSELERLLREVILPGQEWEVERRWAGVMGVGEKKSVILEEVEPGVHAAVRLGGMGVAIGSLIGEKLVGGL